MQMTKWSGYKDIANEGMRHFKELYKEPPRVNIAEFVAITSCLPCFVNHEQNKELMEEVSKEKLKSVVHSFRGVRARVQMDGLVMSFAYKQSLFIGS
jgi:hypothetical protein